MELNFFGKIFILFGAILILLGGLLTLGSKLPFLGRLPGDFLIKREGFTFYFPLATSVILSILLTIIVNFLLRR